MNSREAPKVIQFVIEKDKRAAQSLPHNPEGTPPVRNSAEGKIFDLQKFKEMVAKAKAHLPKPYPHPTDYGEWDW